MGCAMSRCCRRPTTRSRAAAATADMLSNTDSSSVENSPQQSEKQPPPPPTKIITNSGGGGGNNTYSNPPTTLNNTTATTNGSTVSASNFLSSEQQGPLTAGGASHYFNFLMKKSPVKCQNAAAKHNQNQLGGQVINAQESRTRGAVKNFSKNATGDEIRPNKIIWDVSAMNNEDLLLETDMEHFQAGTSTNFTAATTTSCESGAKTKNSVWTKFSAFKSPLFGHNRNDKSTPSIFSKYHLKDKEHHKWGGTKAEKEELCLSYQQDPASMPIGPHLDANSDTSSTTNTQQRQNFELHTDQLYRNFQDRLANTHEHSAKANVRLTDSQLEFFRMLDEKIAQGSSFDYDSYS